MADNLLFEVANESQMSSEPFLQRQVVYVLDQNNSSYNGVVQIDTSTLSNSGKYASYSEGYLEVPLVVSWQATGYAGVANANAWTAGPLNAAWAVGFKNNFVNLIHSISVEYNNTSVVQLTPFTNFYVQYKMMTSLSQDDVHKFGTGIGFWPDTPTGWSVNGVTSNNGANPSLAGYFQPTNSYTTSCGFSNNRNFGIDNLGPSQVIGTATIPAGTAFGNTPGADGPYYTSNAVTIQVSTGGSFTIPAGTLLVYNYAQALNPVLTLGTTPLIFPVSGGLGGFAYIANGQTISAAAIARNAPLTIPVNNSITATIYSANPQGLSFQNANGPWNSNNANYGFYKRQTSTCFDPTQNPFSQIIPTTGIQTVGKNYYTQSTTDNAHYWLVIARIRLKDICDFFDKLPLIKGAYIRMIINTNTATHNIRYLYTNATQAVNLFTTSNIITGGTTPLLVAGSGVGHGAYPLLNAVQQAGISAGANAYIDTTLAVNIYKNTSINTANATNSALTSCRLYVPLYTLNPAQEEQYLSLNRTKKIVYRDIYQYQYNLSPSNGSANFNVLLTNGIVNPKTVIIIPIYSQTVVGQPALSANQWTAGNYTQATQLTLPANQSIWTTEPSTTSPLVVLTDFNIQIAGVNMFVQNEKFSFEQFQNELSSQNAINGGLIDGLVSGLISETDYQYGFSYYVCDVARRMPSENQVPKSVQILGNYYGYQPVTLYCFIEFEREIEVDLMSGQKVA